MVDINISFQGQPCYLKVQGNGENTYTNFLSSK